MEGKWKSAKIDYNKKNIWNSYFWQMNRRVWSIVIWNGAICMFLYDEGVVKAVCVVTEEGEDLLELKNLAVCPQCQRSGYGRKMIEFLCKEYKGRKTILQAGTGDSPATLPFYESCGFTQSHRIPGFFCG